MEPSLASPPYDKPGNWQRLLDGSSVSLQQLGENNLPTVGASGLLCEFEGHRLVLTAGHAVRAGGVWGMVVKYVPEKGTEIFKLGSFTTLARIRDLGARVEEVDLSLCEVAEEVAPLAQDICELSLQVKSQFPLIVHKVSLDETPRKGVWYGFSGDTRQVIEAHASPPLPLPHVVESTRAIVGAIEYVGDEDDMHLFKILGGHPGHESFKGCSGAPIIDERGTVVALVCGGDRARGVVRGISLKAYKSALLAGIASNAA